MQRGRQSDVSQLIHRKGPQKLGCEIQLEGAPQRFEVVQQPRPIQTGDVDGKLFEVRSHEAFLRSRNGQIGRPCHALSAWQR